MRAQVSRAKKFTEPATIIVKWKGRIENFIANCEENRGAVSIYNKNRSKKPTGEESSQATQLKSGMGEKSNQVEKRKNKV